MDISTNNSSSSGSRTRATPKIIYSAPASPTSATTATPTASAAVDSSPASGAAAGGATAAAATGHHQQRVLSPTSTLSTPKKHFLDAVMLHALREKLRTPRGSTNSGELLALRLSGNGGGINGGSIASTLSSSSSQPPLMNIIKDRYLISTLPCPPTASAAAKTPSSYRHLIDLSSSNLRCTDVFTERQYLCKIINEPLHKVQRAYFQLAQAADDCHSTIHGHALIRGVHDIVPLSAQRTYIIIANESGVAAEEEETEETEAKEEEQCSEAMDVEEECATAKAAVGGVIYEDLHTYIRNKRRLGEAEARALFHQICQTVQVCHRHGIILRDLKLKRFYFVDAARTKLQYESLEGSMILDDPADDTLSDKIGCPLYTAPELLCPQPTYHGKPADMWSLGVILYTMLVGQYPFYEKGNCNLITIIRHCHVQVPSSLSRSVRWLLLSLLRKQYAERMSVEHVFYAPWLRSQRSYYAHVPVDVVIPDDDNNNNDAVEFVLQAQLEPMDEAAAAVAVPAQFCLTTKDQAGALPQPLDYTRHALQLQQQHQLQLDVGVDVEMAG